MNPIAFFSIACLLMAASAASAQVNTLVADNPRENARLKLGPIYVTPYIELKEFGVDTNVFNGSGERQKDFTFTVAPTAMVWLPFARRGLLKATLAPDLVWYKQFATERSVDPSVTVRGEAYLRRVTVFGENAFLRSRQRPNFEIDLRSRRHENRLNGGVDVRLTPKVSVEVSGTKSSVEFDGDAFVEGTALERTLNQKTTGFGTVGRYRPSVLTALALKVDRFADRFPLSPARGSDNVRVMAGMEFHPRALINGQAYAGVRQLKPVDESLLPEFSGLVSDVNLSYILLGSTTISVSHSRDVGYSFEPFQPYYVDTGAGIRVRRALGSRFDALVSTARHTYAYRDLMLQNVSARSARMDTIWNTAGSLGYRLGREGRVGFGVTYWRRDSTTRSLREYSGLRIGTTATYGF